MLSSIGKPRLSKSAEISNVLLANCNSKSMASGVVMDHPRKQGPKSTIDAGGFGHCGGCLGWYSVPMVFYVDIWDKGGLV